MNRGKTLDSIPTDLFLEIFSRLSAKSVGRCRCVSKLWASMLVRQDFTELFLTRSSARPRFLFPVVQNGECSFYSSPQLQNPNEKSSLIVAADYHSKFLVSRGRNRNINYASGLIYFTENRISEEAVRVICSPITGQYAVLPELMKNTKWNNSNSYLGFDPINKQFKALFMNNKVNNELVHHILTLGTGKMRWRTIECPFSHNPDGVRICINGVLYYFALHIDEQTKNRSSVIVCFDVRSEKFKFVHIPVFSSTTRLINYKGKLGGIWWSDFLELSIWVLDDVDKQEWSKHVYSLRVKLFWRRRMHVNLFMFSTSIDPERNSLKSVEIQGLEEAFENEYCNVYAFVDYVEDLSVNDAMQVCNSGQSQ